MAAKTLTNAQKLWVSLYAQAEKTASLPSLTKSMGISAEAAQGVYARLIQTQAIAANTAIRFAQPKVPATPIAKAPITAPAKPPAPKPNALDVDVKKIVTDALDLEEHQVELEATQADEPLSNDPSQA